MVFNAKNGVSHLPTKPVTSGVELAPKSMYHVAAKLVFPAYPHEMSMIPIINWLV